eukprot:3154007-Rhodomonas_salina.1
MKWSFDEDDWTWQLTVDGCDLHQITHDLALTCLSDRHVVLAGDSVSRYMGLNLAYFLASSSWTSDPRAPNEMEKLHSNWMDFFQTTNDRMGGNEICDCFREEITGYVPTSTIENRFYSDPIRKIKLIYLQVFNVRHDIELHDLEWLAGSPTRTAANVDEQKGETEKEHIRQDAEFPRVTPSSTSESDKYQTSDSCSSSRGCLPGECSKDEGPLWTFSGGIHRPGVLHGVSRALDLLSVPSADFILNVGLWNHSFLSSQTADLLVDHIWRFSQLSRPTVKEGDQGGGAGRGTGRKDEGGQRRENGESVGKNGVRWHWRTTTASADGERVTIELGQLERLAGGGWGLFDAFQVTETLRLAMLRLCKDNMETCRMATLETRCVKEREDFLACIAQAPEGFGSPRPSILCKNARALHTDCLKRETHLLLQNDDLVLPGDKEQHSYGNLVYWDRFHFQPSVYAALNKVLLAYLCLS